MVRNPTSQLESACQVGGETGRRSRRTIYRSTAGRRTAPYSRPSAIAARVPTNRNSLGLPRPVSAAPRPPAFLVMIYRRLQVASPTGGRTIRQKTFQQTAASNRASASISSVKVAYGVYTRPIAKLHWPIIALASCSRQPRPL